MYKTLPSSLRRKAAHPEGEALAERPPTPSAGGEAAGSSVFGGIHLNISNLFTGGMSQFLGQFRKKTPSSSPSSPGAAAASHPLSGSSSYSSSSSSSAPARGNSLNRHGEHLLTSPAFEEESFELLELSSVLLTEGTGAGHAFAPAVSSNPTWCDHCGQIIWGIYDNVGSKCSLCDLTCHTSCTPRVRLDCNPLPEDKEDTLLDVSELPEEEEDSTLKGHRSINSSFEDPHEMTESMSLSKSDSVYCLSQALNGKELLSSLESYNETFPPGQKTLLEKDQKINGFIRVTMNLRRPINVIAGMRPPSIYRMDESLDREKRTLSTFHLAPNTVKAIHVNSETSTREVIRFLLAKFRIADNPHKYALYERYSSALESSSVKRGSKTLSRIQMRRLAEEEVPLLLALRWAASDLLGVRSLVLQENDPGEICWEAFSLPELKNFLLILDREEAWYKKSIHEKYDHIRNHMEDLLVKKREVEQQP